jgi:hypothetical protein
MHPNSIYATVKQLLAQISNRPVSQITKNLRLSGRWPGGLNLTPQVLTEFVQRLNERLGTLIRRGEVSDGTTVESLCILLKSRVGHPSSIIGKGKMGRPIGRRKSAKKFAKKLAKKPAKKSSKKSAKRGVPSAGKSPVAPTPDAERRVNIWIGAGKTRYKRTLKVGNTYVLNFSVGAPVTDSFTTGPEAIVPARDIPTGGLFTEWLVVARDVEITKGTADTSVTMAMIDGEQTWSGRFLLLIPENGETQVPQLMVKPLKIDSRIDVVVTARNEVYRQFKIFLSASISPTARHVGPARIADEISPTPTAHMGATTRHEWTTAPVLNIIVFGSQAAVLGDVGGNRVDTLEAWVGVQAQVTGPIKNVREAAEDLRAAWENHLNDVDTVDLAQRLQDWGKSARGAHRWGGPEYNWSSLGGYAAAEHQQQWQRMAVSEELRKLALRGWSLFQAFFPVGSKLREWITALSPGARLNISWTPRAGPGYIPHVPWGLMYVAEIPPNGQPVDPMGFLGLRCRVAYTSHDVQNASRSLGALDKTHRAHFLYWGDNLGDITAIEALWQRSQWSIWQNQIFIPQAGMDAKAQVLRLLNNPQPPPTSVLYLFCQSNTGAGNDPALRFGNTNDVSNMVTQTDIGTSILTDRPLVFANACTTAAADPYMANELERAFFDRGCRAYIGTETKVPIVLGSRFAAIFFHFFYRQLDPDPMAAGEAVAQTRLFLWTHYRNIGGLFYSYVNQYDLFLASEPEVMDLR